MSITEGGAVTVLYCKDKSLTVQSEKDSCDINVIMRRVVKTGVIPVNKREAFYADVTSMGEYRDVIEQMRMAEEYFMTLPARVRERFSNDPVELLDFISDANNREEAIEIGLLPKAGEPEVPVEPESASSVDPDPTGD